MSLPTQLAQPAQKPALMRRARRMSVLIFEMAGRSYKLRFAGSYLGILWSILGPLLNALVTATIFFLLMRGRQGGIYAKIPFLVFFFAGFSIWGLVSEIVSRSTTIVLENAALITKISFPTSILPMVASACSFINYAVYLGIACILILIYGVRLSEHLYLLPVYFALAAILATGAGYFLASIGVFVRDTAQAVPVVLNILYYMSPIMYAPIVLRQGAPRWVQAVLLDWNPFSRIIEGYRTSFIDVGAPIDMGGLAYLAVLSGCVFLLGYLCYRALKPSFADVL